MSSDVNAAEPNSSRSGSSALEQALLNVCLRRGRPQYSTLLFLHIGELERQLLETGMGFRVPLRRDF